MSDGSVKNGMESSEERGALGSGRNELSRAQPEDTNVGRVALVVLLVGETLGNVIDQLAHVVSNVVELVEPGMPIESTIRRDISHPARSVVVREGNDEGFENAAENGESFDSVGRNVGSSLKNLKGAYVDVKVSCDPSSWPAVLEIPPAVIDSLANGDLAFVALGSLRTLLVPKAVAKGKGRL